MRPGVVPLPEDASLLEARRAMQSHGAHAVLVVGRAHGHRVPRQSFSAIRHIALFGTGSDDACRMIARHLSLESRTRLEISPPGRADG
jgi:CBS domain-containing protein